MRRFSFMRCSQFPLLAPVMFLSWMQIADAENKWELSKGDDPEVYRSFGVVETVCIAHDERVRIKIFELKIRVHYQKYDAGTNCFTALGAGTTIYVRAEEDNVRIALDGNDARAWEILQLEF